MYHHYYVHTSTDNHGDYEVHQDGCDHMPNASNRQYLGYFTSCAQAVSQAKANGYRTADGCYWCCRECHTS
ncbi:TPA: hypothetical protein ACPUIE_003427 [Proteus mirabilis]|uniref:Uncharacterized protein n=1 Tax=Proteus terrae subsp. cibarius TaxID=626774 RepID=A0ABX6JM86_9GAMM|nr:MULTISPECIES: hypothetical protein [Proteus]AVE42459.1 hypothetical protein AM353_11840 [Providencia stuartii]EKT8673550.1 hypothetical protein [Proteus mirabilis]EKU9860736.1 hypothetical protein [Proteus mirabilis]EKX4457112.1 hypothetical protein [Proteus mirabilis]EKX4632004.1 hypothetical protein [Proteus mirabilis]